MSPEPQTEDLEVHGADHQVPEEISDTKGLSKANGSGVPIYSLDCVHTFSLFVEDDNPERQGVDNERLDQRYDMDIPVDTSASVELRIMVRKQACGYGGRGNRLDKLVQGDGKEDFMNMVWKRGKVQKRGERLCDRGEGSWRRGNGVEHFGGLFELLQERMRRVELAEQLPRKRQRGRGEDAIRRSSLLAYRGRKTNVRRVCLNIRVYHSLGTRATAIA